jgi:choline dehydrogenase-like flavoprotein
MDTGDGKPSVAAAPPRAATLPDELLAKAQNRLTTPFDYIVIGSGAGGGPLAARLAEGGRRVLVLEAGADAALEPRGASNDPPGSVTPHLREVYKIPGYHAAATEDPAMCWSYSVRHYADTAVQGLDSKYREKMDPSTSGKPGKGGILYPRSSGLGGCTSHHAMIVIKPNDCDWNRIAERTGDESWRAEKMQGYFARIEDCLYYKTYQGFLRKFLLAYMALMRVATFFKPRSQMDTGGHGFSGWQRTSFIDPELVVKIAWGDRTFLCVLFGALLSLLRRNGQWRALLCALVSARPVQFLDPNFGDDRGSRSLRPAFIPVGTNGVRRRGIRERLLRVAKERPGHLVLHTDAFARRLIFAPGTADMAPHAIGVEVDLGSHLYEASPLSAVAQRRGRVQFFARREIIVSAGAFNTPQLLMLSGIGDAEHLRAVRVAGPRDAAGEIVCGIIDLPGVGRNLQDRYEVSVITTASRPFSTLDGVSFDPGDSSDPARRQWLEHKDGLYTTNGGALAFLFASSKAHKGVPDIFIFGAPAAFRGYYWGWSKDLLHAVVGEKTEQRDLWSWILLKAYTQNKDGTVRLRGSSPSAQPEIDFHSFGEKSGKAEAAEDFDAIAEGIKRIRDINAGIRPFDHEIQPGADVSDGEKLRAWIGREAWGHHACGTCRMGSDRWQASPAKLTDRDAVLDSEFRVHGVHGLRVVDASVFPDIPGYFIVTPIFMVGEKAADVLLGDPESYPHCLEAAEAAAIRARRLEAPVGAGNAASVAGEPDRLPNDTVGLALSGGGVRSATFCLGVLQGLASSGRLTLIDVLSTVSGGGYIGGFLGRLYTRMKRSVTDPAQRVCEILSDIDSRQVWWLRANARYLTGAGLTDLENNTGTIWRNLLAIHVWIATLIIALEAILYWFACQWQTGGTTAAGAAPFLGIPWSPWWWLPAGVVVVGLIPAWLSFWLSPSPGTNATISVGGLIVWLVALASAIAVLGVPATSYLSVVAILALLLAGVWLEAAQWGIPSDNQSIARSAITRNRLTRGAGIALGVFVLTLLWAVIDTLADYVGSAADVKWISAVMGLTAAALPTLRSVVAKAVAQATSFASAAASARATATAIATVVQGEHVSRERRVERPGPDRARGDAKVVQLGKTILFAAIGFLLITFMVFGLDVIAHWAFHSGFGTWLLGLSLAASVAVGPATAFVNLSSLQSLYAARLARTYLGATNEARVQQQDDPEAKDVDSAQPDDDLFLHDYHPEQRGGPLHLINVCVNQTVDPTSGRQLKEDKGLPMCLGPAGISVGLVYHALWERRSLANEGMADRMLRGLQDAVVLPEDARSAVRALPVAPDPNAFHVLASRKTKVVAVEPLRLSQWMSISGAAVSTGEGRLTSLPVSFLLGLFNVRLGYWWNSHIKHEDRPGCYPPSFWRRLKSLPGLLFRTQRAILNEWRAYFTGPSHKLWYLSDGGHYDNTGLYELIRRRLPFIIAIESYCDPQYTFPDLAILVRTVRLDFDARVTWLDPTQARTEGLTGWEALAQAAGKGGISRMVTEWLNPEALGPLDMIERRGPFAAALARIDYGDRVEPSWLVLLKACLPSQVSLPLDIRSYAELNASFPNQTTVDQFFTDDQWESYRLLGQTLASALFAAKKS